MKRFHLLRWTAFVVLALVGMRQVSHAVDTTMVVPDLGVMFQTQTVVAHANEIPRAKLLTDFDGMERWINTEGLRAGDVDGKVVLVQFWSYTCVPCVDAIPYMKGWWSLYRRFGLQVVGIHAPSVYSEANVENVTDAVRDYGITYPVGFDGNFTIWGRFANRVWPATFLFDRDGTLAYVHDGAGGYEETEAMIQALLDVTPEDVEVVTPEPKPPASLAFGHDKQHWYAGPERLLKDASQIYSFPARLENYQWALEGEWIVYADHAESVSPGAKVRFVLTKPSVDVALSTSTEQQTKATVRVDGRYATPDMAGPDLAIETNTTGESVLIIESLNHFAALANLVGTHTIEIEFPTPGGELWNVNYPPDDAE